MSATSLAAIALLCVSAVASLAMVLRHLATMAARRSVERDDALAEHGPRLRQLEERIKALEWRGK